MGYQANALTRAIIEYLNLSGFKAWANNTGAVRIPVTDNAPSRFVRFGEKGSTDILAISPYGILWAIEIKAGRDQVKPHQQAWMDDIVAHNGVAFVARSLDDVIERVANNVSS